MSSAKSVHHYFLPVFVLLMVLTFIIDSTRSLHSSDVKSQMAFLKSSVVPLHSLNDNNAIMQLVGQVPLVLIGDSTHGTHEFYQQRITISKQLIQEKNFKLILLEADWPNVYTLNQYVQSAIHVTAEQALDVFNPQSAWLWSNLEMLNFIQWLKSYNEQLPDGEQKVSLLGMDIYSFEQSMTRVIDYLQSFSLQAAQQAQQRYQCFNRFNNDLHRYGRAVSRDQSLSCQQAVVEQYQDFSDCRFPCPEQYPFIDREAFFNARQNARIVKNIEQSLRIQYMSGDSSSASWNQRDRHMMESFLALSDHLHHPKTIIWAHNSHIGNARATDMAESAQINLGQLLRQRFSQQLIAIGMLTYSGTVRAADNWNRPAKLKVILPAHPESNEALFHQLGIAHFMLDLHQSTELAQILNHPRLQRHIGVVYRPETEMRSHYSYAQLADQFDVIIYLDETTAVTPLNSN